MSQVGGITVTTKMDGKLSLSTKHRQQSEGGTASNGDNVTQVRRILRVLYGIRVTQGSLDADDRMDKI